MGIFKALDQDHHYSPFRKVGNMRWNLRIFDSMLPFNKNLKAFARDLRRNMTDAELHIWKRIRRKQLKGHQFYRQKNIGSYIVDFYCPAAHLIIEIDGGQHYGDEGLRKDAIRDDYLASLGFVVIRFSDREVLKNIEAVLENVCGYL
jgi:very-short-patch-repair endonuclease